MGKSIRLNDAYYLTINEKKKIRFSEGLQLYVTD